MIITDMLTLIIVLLPMSMYEPVLLDALVSWVTGYPSLQHNSYCEVSTRNKGRALQTLAKSLSSHEVSLFAQLAICLVLCSMESIMTGHDGTWYTHLTGTAGTIHRLQQDSDAEVRLLY